MDIDTTFNFNSYLSDANNYLAHGPNPATTDQAQVRRLESASSVGNLEAVQEQLEDLRCHTSQWLQSLGGSIVLATQNHHYDLVQYFLSLGHPLDMSLVRIATLGSDTAMLEIFLLYGWQINQPLDWATPPALALAINNLELVTWFLDRGANPNAQCLLDLTPLSVAVEYAAIDIIRLLLERGGSTQYGCLLHHAARRDLQDRLEVVLYLSDRGADKTINDVMYHDYTEAYQLQAAFGLGTPLHEAARKGNLDMVELLISRGADPHVLDSLQRTPLQCAESAQHVRVVELLKKAVTVLPKYEGSAGLAGDCSDVSLHVTKP